jgi:hypothetical protein
LAGKPWSKEESGFVKRNYRTLGCKQVADRLGRSLRSVYQHANKLGVNEIRDIEAMALNRVRIRELNALGWSDGEISEEVGLNRRTVSEIRVKLGLPCNRLHERFRNRVREKTAQQLKAAGLKNLGQVRSERFKQLARDLGWPDTLSLRSVQIIEMLYQRGPMTRRQLAQAIDMPWKGSKTFSNRRVPGQSYTAELIRSGLVIVLQRAVRRGGKGNNDSLYMVALGVEPCHKARSQSQLLKSKIPSQHTEPISQCSKDSDKRSSIQSQKATLRQLFRSKSRKRSKATKTHSSS